MRSVIVPLAAAFTVLAVSQTAMGDTLEDAMGAYVEGLKTGDVKTLNKLFHDQGQFCVNRKSEIKCTSFAEALPTWVEKPDPAASGQLITKEIVEDSMARVSYQLDFGGENYLDYFLLYKNGGRWIVVSKTTFIKE